jgi:peptidoglycan/LPS O-acetylase OafA/YrhL
MSVPTLSGPRLIKPSFRRMPACVVGPPSAHHGGSVTNAQPFTCGYAPRVATGVASGASRMQAISSGRSERSNALDALRGVAILLVVAYHWFGLPLGWTGVDLFFVLSGYLIGGILINNRTSKGYYSTFYARRIFRILPLYLLFLSIVLPIFGSTIPIWNYLTFTPNIAWAHGGPLGVASVTWSLGVEEQFYLLLPMLVRITSIDSLAVISIGCIAMAPLCRIALIPLFGSPMAAHFLLPAKMDALFAGVLIACVCRRPELLVTVRNHARLLWVIGSASAVALVLFATQSPRDFGDGPLPWSIACSLINLIFGCLLLGLIVSNWQPKKLLALSWVGVGAYSIYLIHEPVRVFAEALAHAWGVPRAVALGIAAVFISQLSVICWTRIESPMIRWSRNHWSYESARQKVPLYQ